MPARPIGLGAYSASDAGPAIAPAPAAGYASSPAKAVYGDGVLEVRIPKAEQVKPIPVKVLTAV